MQQSQQSQKSRRRSEDIPGTAELLRPEGVLIRLHRKAAGLKIQQAAHATDWKVSATRWSQIETGRERRRGQTVQARATDTTLAHMAAAIGVTPEQLTDAGRRDAAEVLEELLRQKASAASSSEADPAAASSLAP